VEISSEEEPAAKIERESDCDAVCEGSPESVALTMKEELPTADGVPEIVPVAAKVTPAGSVPDDTLQAYGAVPPVAARLAEYAACTVPDVNDVVSMVTVATDGEPEERFLLLPPVTPTQPVIPNAAPRIAQTSAPAFRARVVFGRHSFA
jgi:hypothetical protein